MSEAETILRNSTPFDIAKQDIDDLYYEASNWLDGGEIQSQDEADMVRKLLNTSRAAKKSADAERKKENEPFDTGKKEVQARYNFLLKRADLIADCCKTTLQPWLDSIQKAKDEEARIAREEAEAAERAAQEAMAKTSVGDIEERAEAERLAETAKSAIKTATKITNSSNKNTGLRTVWAGEIVDIRAAIEYYYSTQKGRDRFNELTKQLLDEDVREGVRTVPGCAINSDRKAV